MVCPAPDHCLCNVLVQSRAMVCPASGPGLSNHRLCSVLALNRPGSGAVPVQPRSDSVICGGLSIHLPYPTYRLIPSASPPDLLSCPLIFPPYLPPCSFTFPTLPYRLVPSSSHPTYRLVSSHSLPDPPASPFTFPSLPTGLSLHLPHPTSRLLPSLPHPSYRLIPSPSFLDLPFLFSLIHLPAGPSSHEQSHD